MQRHHFKIEVFVTALLPIIWMMFALFTNRLGANPIEALTRDSGLWALRFLYLTLIISPIYWYVGLNWVFLRRMIGLYAFFYASIHMLLYLWLDQFFDVDDIVRDIIKRPFITVGFLSFIALIPLAVTSNNAMIKKMGGKLWKKLHRLTYFIVVAASIHFYMLVKQDKREPLLYLLILFFILLPRLIRYVNEKLAQKQHLRLNK
jgi:sulfoxide reductase heme-binding subunit YedZ